MIMLHGHDIPTLVLGGGSCRSSYSIIVITEDHEEEDVTWKSPINNSILARSCKMGSRAQDILTSVSGGGSCRLFLLLQSYQRVVWRRMSSE